MHPHLNHLLPFPGKGNECGNVFADSFLNSQTELK